MSDSLKDQLLALGFKKSKPVPEPRRDNRQQAKPHHRDRPKPAKPPQRNDEADLAKAYAIRDRTEREERERAQREAEQKARERKERKAKLIALLAGKNLADANADVARHFPHGDKIRRIYVTAEQLPKLNRGELGVVQVAGRYQLVDRAVALEAQAISAEALVLLPDPNAPVEDDIPPDLVW